MLDESKNLKDTPKDTISMPVAYEANDFRSGSYKKTNKLVSALYMVTDIMEKDEPLRNKLRTLGADIVSDTYLLSIPNPSKVRQLNLGTRGNIEIKIAELLSFLEISSSINLISEMNYRILKKEFIELEQSVQEYIRKSSVNQPATLSEFFIEDSKGHAESFTFFKGHPVEDKGHETTRIGVQKGST
ncbi:MAG: hypothetical protein KBC06_02570, partial [Candidatus Pacebacteria bacterium]|nr:hypothetical protein [Candidatus Paceibacterota bacterium]